MAAATHAAFAPVPASDSTLPESPNPAGASDVPLTSVDRTLLQRCLQHHKGAWNDFVDRFLGLVYHVIHFTAHQRSVPLQPEDIEDLASEVLLQIVANNYQVLHQFRGQSSFAAYLTVIARRICVQELSRRAAQTEALSRRPRELAERP